MKLVDAHIHISDPQYLGCTDAIIQDAKDSNVAALVNNAVDYETSIAALRIQEKNPELVYTALGIHPWNVNNLKEGELEQTLKLIEEQHAKKRLVAIGEIGLDCSYESIWNQQVLVFDKMLRLAEKLDLPVVIHSRGTTELIVDMLPSYNLKRVLLHWFSHPMPALAQAVERGYCITEGPPTVYSNGIREVINNTPITNIMTETDGPVLFRKPPFNAQMTKPSFVREVVGAIAEIKNMPIDAVAEQIVQNFETFFNKKLS
jgi:TatD DNase family protein